MTAKNYIEAKAIDGLTMNAAEGAALTEVQVSC